METPLHRGAFPRASGLARAVNKRRETGDIGKDIEHSVVMAEAWRPDTASINVFAILEAELGSKVEAVTGIGKKRPVDKVF